MAETDIDDYLALTVKNSCGHLLKMPVKNRLTYWDRVLTDLVLYQIPSQESNGLILKHNDNNLDQASIDPMVALSRCHYATIQLQIARCSNIGRSNNTIRAS